MQTPMPDEVPPGQVPTDGVGPDEALTESRIDLLRHLLDRRMPLYRVTPGTAAERLVILAVAQSVLPPAYPPSAEQAEAARILKRAVACPGFHHTH